MESRRRRREKARRKKCFSRREFSNFGPFRFIGVAALLFFRNKLRADTCWNRLTFATKIIDTYTPNALPPSFEMKRLISYFSCTAEKSVCCSLVTRLGFDHIYFPLTGAISVTKLLPVPSVIPWHGSIINREAERGFHGTKIGEENESRTSYAVYCSLVAVFGPSSSSFSSSLVGNIRKLSGHVPKRTGPG